MNVGLNAEAANIVDNIRKDIYDLTDILDKTNATVEKFTTSKSEWKSEAADHCKQRVDSHIKRAKELFDEMIDYVLSVQDDIQKTFDEDAEMARRMSNM